MKKLLISVAFLFSLISTSYANFGGGGFGDGGANGGSSGSFTTITTTGNSNLAANVGIGSVSPGMALDVQGAIRSTGGFNTASWVDPIDQYNASGSNATTTGTISSGTNSLVVASATGWTVGMGIAVTNAGSGGTTRLISSVTAISGTTFTLANNASATATTQTVNHDDTVALTAAIQSGKNVHIRGGTYNTSSAVIFNQGVWVDGDGWCDVPSAVSITKCTRINNQGTTNNVLDFTGVGVSNPMVSNLTITQDSNFTHSAGWGMIFSSASVMYNPTLRYVQVRGTFDGIKIGAQVTAALFDHVVIVPASGSASNIGFEIADPPPYGAHQFNNLISICPGQPCHSMEILATDQATFNNSHFGGGGVTGTNGDVYISDDIGTIDQVTFNGMTIENSSNSHMLFLNGTNVYGISFNGGEITNGDSLHVGMFLLGGHNINVQGMNIADQVEGILIGASYVTITGNTFRHIHSASPNTAYGIQLGSTSTNVTMSGNVFGSDVDTNFLNQSNLTGNSYGLNSDSLVGVGIGTVVTGNILQIGGNVGIGTAQGGSIITRGNSLVLSQTGDAFGTSSISVVNRTGFAGGQFTNSGLDLVDLGFQSSTASVNNFRMEHRASNELNALNTTGEFQFINPPSTTWFASGQNVTALNSGNLGIGTNVPGQKLDVVGTIRALKSGTCTTLYLCQGGVDAGVIQTSACVLCPASTCVAMNGCF